METNNVNETKTQVYSICQKLMSMVPPIRLNTSKADETIRYWLPEIPINQINRYKNEFIKDSKTNNN